MDQFESGRPLEEDPMLPTPPREAPRPEARNVPLALAWAVVVATGGGFACGAIFLRFGDLACLGLWPMGVLAGWVGRKIIVHPNRLVGRALAGACVAAGFVYLVCRVHWGIVGGDESWLAAIELLPRFLQERWLAGLMIACFTYFGAQAAYSQTAVRFRWVRVREE